MSAVASVRAPSREVESRCPPCWRRRTPRRPNARQGMNEWSVSFQLPRAVLRRVSPSHTRVFVSSSLLLKKRRANFSSERRTAHDAMAEQRRGPSRGCGFASARRHLGVAPAGSRVARGKMGSAPGLTDVERPRASAEATTPTKAVDAMRVSTGHRLSFGIGGVSENDPKPAIGTHEFGETVRERQHASVTRRASRIARRYPRVVLPPLFRMVEFSSSGGRISTGFPLERARHPSERS